MSNNINPLEYLYQNTIKLDYFILSADIAVLSWTIVNTEWLPQHIIFTYLIGLVWIFIFLSILCGIIGQILSNQLFGINHLYLEVEDYAGEIEMALLQSQNFINKQTGEPISPAILKRNAINLRNKVSVGKDKYAKVAKKSSISGGLMIIFLILSLLLLAGIKFYALYI